MVLLLIALLGWGHAASELNFLFMFFFLPNFSYGSSVRVSVFLHSLKAWATDLPVDSRSFKPNSAAQFYDLAQRAELA